jgi:hypothetical protein
MRELHGVMFAGRPNINMKRCALLFDKFQIWRYDGPEHERTEEFEVEISFLKERGVVVAPSLEANDFADASLRGVERYAETIFAQPSHGQTKHIMIVANGVAARDCGSRAIAAKVREQSDCDVVPICEVDLPTELLNASDSSVIGDIVKVAIERLPTPDESCSWQDIIDFKAEKRDQQWDLRRFLHTLATKTQTKAEIRDDIDWSLGEYTKAMKRRRMNIVNSAVTGSIIPAVDVLFNPMGHHLLSMIGGALAINKLRIELLDGEANAKGRECAYMFEAQKRFGRSR